MSVPPFKYFLFIYFSLPLSLSPSLPLSLSPSLPLSLSQFQTFLIFEGFLQWVGDDAYKAFRIDRNTFGEIPDENTKLKILHQVKRGLGYKSLV